MKSSDWRIDAHQHFWHYDPIKDAWIDEIMSRIKQDFLPEDLEPVLKLNDIDGCVAVQASQTELETEFLIGLAQRHDIIKGVVGWVNLLAPDLDERLTYYSKDPYLKGIRHVAQGESDDFLSRKDVKEGIGKLGKYDLVYDILIFERQLPAAIDLVKSCPDLPFVLDHIAKPLIKDQVISPWKENIKELAAFDNVMCKVSGMVTEADWKGWRREDFEPYLDVVFEAFGADRIMFGSDWPVCLLGGEYSEIKGILSTYTESFSSEEKRKIWGANAVRFYKL
ncbi:amidohydrolase [Marinoscillum sp. MHG1-6]|uniref:amidohydrolase family protein n=1 Tax=Marinoscillum sp. MHG1-6 TaxID=2959627 RepID=UPI002157C54D|nr:amidohydrolase family protein [Marinoscillum sp. MHG1-6]